MSSGPVVDLVVRNSQLGWLNARRYLNRNRPSLARAAVELYPGTVRVGSTPLMAMPEWVPAAPVELVSVEMSWREAAPRPRVTGTAVASEAVRALRATRQPYETYAAAVAELDRFGAVENRPTYRLVDADPGPRRLGFAPGWCSDMFDVSEAVAHELAAAQLEGADTRLRSLPFRSLIGDPFDLARRPVQVATSVFTLRVDAGAGAGAFLVHGRDMLQPTAGEAWDATNDLDLWRILVREYSEEILDAPERRGVGGPLDYEVWPFHHAMSQARRQGAIRPHFLGLGIDPLTLAAVILLAVAFDAAAFDELFARTAVTEETGVVPFDERSIRTALAGRPVQPGAAAVLDLARRHRTALLGAQ